MGAVQDSVHITLWVVILSLNGKSLKFEIDTSADVSFIPQKVFKSIPGASIKCAKTPLVALATMNSPCECRGSE